MDTLNREQAKLPQQVWDAIDRAAADAAKPRLTGRRFLDVEGPFGVGLTAIEVGNDDYCRQPGDEEAGIVMGRAISVPMLRRTFSLSVRRLAAHLDYAQPLDRRQHPDQAGQHQRLFDMPAIRFGAVSRFQHVRSERQVFPVADPIRKGHERPQHDDADRDRSEDETAAHASGAS